MGALIMMREEPMDAPIPDSFEPSDYHKVQMGKAINELSRLKCLSEEEIEAAAKAAYLTRYEENSEWKAKREELNVKYLDMLAKVSAWKAPTPDHEGFKEFMSSQIEQSIKFDCGDYETEIERLTGVEWIEFEVKKANGNIEYHRDRYEKDVKAAAARTEWIQQLKQSLGPPPLTKGVEH
ncbi:MAG: hypothetical protein V4714_17750 [Bacteroidota bacterium]